MRAQAPVLPHCLGQCHAEQTEKEYQGTLEGLLILAEGGQKEEEVLQM